MASLEEPKIEIEPNYNLSTVEDSAIRYPERPPESASEAEERCASESRSSKGRRRKKKASKDGSNEFVRLNGVRVPWAKLTEAAMQVCKNDESVAASAAWETKFVQASAKTGAIEEELYIWRERFDKGMSDKELSDYNLFLQSLRERIFKREEDLKRQHSVAKATLAALTRQGGGHSSGRARQYASKIQKIEELARVHNEHVRIWNVHKDDVFSCPQFKALQEHVQETYEIRENGVVINKKQDEADAAMSFEDFSKALMLEEQNGINGAEASESQRNDDGLGVPSVGVTKGLEWGARGQRAEKPQGDAKKN